jgi:opacity protein-like surface antigen
MAALRAIASSRTKSGGGKQQTQSLPRAESRDGRRLGRAQSDRRFRWLGLLACAQSIHGTATSPRAFLFSVVRDAAPSGIDVRTIKGGSERMKRMMIAALFMAALATSAMAAASASATPDPTYHTCVKSEPAKTGKFNDKNCSVANAGGTGKYEIGDWTKAKKKSFKGTLGLSVLKAYITEGPEWGGGKLVVAVECQSGKSAGSITGPSTSAVTVEFKGCMSAGKRCTSGSKPGVITTRPLVTELGWIASGIGQRFSAASGNAAEFECEGYKVVVYNKVIGAVSGNVDAFGKFTTTTFAIDSRAGQEVRSGEFSGVTSTTGLLTTLPPGVIYAAGLGTTSVIKGENLSIY